MLPTNRVGRLRSILLCKYLYIVICTRFLAVLFHMYITVHSTWTDTICRCSHSSTKKWGPKRSPFTLPCGAFYISTIGQEQERVARLFGPRVHLVKILYIFTHNHLWLVIVILKVSISSSSAFLYCTICICIF